MAEFLYAYPKNWPARWWNAIPVTDSWLARFVPGICLNAWILAAMLWLDVSGPISTKVYFSLAALLMTVCVRWWMLRRTDPATKFEEYSSPSKGWFILPKFLMRGKK
jgi:hypothetical protein